MRGEVATVMAAIERAESQRSVDFHNLQNSVEGVKSNLPTKATVRNYVLAGFAGVVAFLALVWAIFDTGAGVVGSFSEQVLEQKQQQHDIQRKLDQLLQDKQNGDAKRSEVPGNSQ